MSAVFTAASRSGQTQLLRIARDLSLLIRSLIKSLVCRGVANNTVGYHACHVPGDSDSLEWLVQPPIGLISH